MIPAGGGASGRPLADPGQEAPLSALHPNPRQPRTHFDDTALAELADSIKSNGLLQPILVRPRTAGGYEIVAGERRCRAALRAGLTHVPIIVRILTDEETLALALIENLIREDIGPLESARAFRQLMDDFGWTQEELSQRVGKSRPAVANSLRLLELPRLIQQSVEAAEISEGHARTLLGDARERTQDDFKRHQMKVWNQIRAKGLSVRDTERMMKDRAPAADGAHARPTARLSNDLSSVQDRLRSALGTRVRLVGTESRGRIELEYSSVDELDRLLSVIEGSGPAESVLHVPAPISGLLSSRHPLK